MKKFLTFVGMVSLLLIIGTVFLSCGGGGKSGVARGSPSDVSIRFLEAVQKGDQKAIKNLSTEETGELMVALLSKMQEALKEQEIDVKKLKTEETIDGDHAHVKLFSPDDEGNPIEFDLVKVNGNWKVDVNIGK